MPLLHRAVLFDRPEIVDNILEDKPLKESIDNLFDQVFLFLFYTILKNICYLFSFYKNLKYTYFLLKIWKKKGGGFILCQDFQSLIIIIIIFHTFSSYLQIAYFIIIRIMIHWMLMHSVGTFFVTGALTW